MSRYLDRQLSGEESAWFEAYAMDKADLLQAIDADSDLRDAIAAAGMEIASAGAANNVTKPHATKAWLPGMWRRYGISALATAASLLVAVGAGWTSNQWLTARSARTIVANPTLIRLYGPQRGSGDSLVCVQNAERWSERVTVEAILPVNATDVRMQFGGTEIAGLTPSPDGTVSSSVPRQVVAAAKTMKVVYSVNGKEVSQSNDSIHLLATGKQVGNPCS